MKRRENRGYTAVRSGSRCESKLASLLRADDSQEVDDITFPNSLAVDWPTLPDEARSQGVGPLLYHQLRQSIDNSGLPPQTAEALRQMYSETWTKNLFYMQALDQVLAVLAAADIRPILLKGASLALTVYPQPALRPMNDLDLLVAPWDFRLALHTLQAAGCLALHGEPFNGAYEMVTHHVGLVLRREIDVLVELHHQWLSLPQDQARLVTWDDLYQRTQTIQVGQASALVLGVEDQLLHLCAHMAIHSPLSTRLIWYYDVDQVIRLAGTTLNWDVVVDRALAYQMVLPLQTVLPVLAANLGTPVPAALLASLAGLPVTTSQRQRYGADALGFHTRLGDGLQKLAGLGGTSERLRFIRGNILPDWSYMRSLYPDDSPPRLVTRYPARWAEIAAEFERTLRRRFPL